MLQPARILAVAVIVAVAGLAAGVIASPPPAKQTSDGRRWW